ncbi:MAG: SDR family NAD(P)-dependent oxidoreductase [Myxococcota bacterium]
MTKTILITGSTDGIGLETAAMLAEAGHRVVLHGRNAQKLENAKQAVLERSRGAHVDAVRADLSRLDQVRTLATEVSTRCPGLDVLFNNAGVFKTPKPRTDDGQDTRFIVNTVAPYLLTQLLLPSINKAGRIINLSSAAQATVDFDALHGKIALSDGEAYAQSKLGITMWSFHLAESLGADGPSVIAVNPASFLGSKMVKEAYGQQGKDLRIGADILVRAAVSEEFEGVTGKYFDNDIERFAQPHPDATVRAKNEQLVQAIKTMLSSSAK